MSHDQLNSLSGRNAKITAAYSEPPSPFLAVNKIGRSVISLSFVFSLSVSLSTNKASGHH